MHRSPKPVRKCNGCGLNFRDYCGIFANPHEQWRGRSQCRGHMNEALLAEYESKQETLRDKKGHIKRKLLLQKMGSEHHNGDRHVAIIR